jgi:hypothetical protein
MERGRSYSARVKGIRGVEVLPLLAKAIRQSRQSRHRHSDRKVLSFNVWSAHAIWVGAFVLRFALRLSAIRLTIGFACRPVSEQSPIEFSKGALSARKPVRPFVVREQVHSAVKELCICGSSRASKS